MSCFAGYLDSLPKHSDIVLRLQRVLKLCGSRWAVFAISRAEETWI
jgi:hypothetical protein